MFYESLFANKFTLVGIMACCLKAPSHYLYWCWPRYMASYLAKIYGEQLMQSWRYHCWKQRSPIGVIPLTMMVKTMIICCKVRCGASFEVLYIDGLVQDCSNSIANALELLQSCTKPSTWPYDGLVQERHNSILTYWSYIFLTLIHQYMHWKTRQCQLHHHWWHQSLCWRQPPVLLVKRTLSWCQLPVFSVVAVGSAPHYH